MNLESLRKLCEKATEGPWKLADWCGAPPDPDNPNCIEGPRIPPSTMFPDLGVQVMMFDECGDNRLNDAAFIAAARTALPLLLDVAIAARWSTQVAGWHTGELDFNNVRHKCNCRLCAALRKLEAP